MAFFETKIGSTIANFGIKYVPVIYDTRKKRILKILSPAGKRSE